MRVLKVVVLAALILMGAGYVGCGGGGAKVESQITTKTIGQQLMDLKAAYDKGAISEAEYQKMRQEILKRYE